MHPTDEKILKEFDKQFENDNLTCECSKKVFKSFLISSLSTVRAEAVKEENWHWLNGHRCERCGKEMKPEPMTNTCKECWEND